MLICCGSQWRLMSRSYFNCHPPLSVEQSNIVRREQDRPTIMLWSQVSQQGYMVYHMYMIQLISQCCMFTSVIQIMNWTKAKQIYDLLSGVTLVCIVGLSKLLNFSVIYGLSVSACVNMFIDTYSLTCLTTITCCLMEVQ